MAEQVRLSPSIRDLTEDILRQDQWRDMSVNAGWVTVSNGSGLVAESPSRLRVDSRATGGSDARARTQVDLNHSRGKANNVLDWSKRVVIKVSFSVNAGTCDGSSRITLGKGSGDGIGGFSDKGIGIEINDQALSGITHDGSCGDTVDLSTTLTTDRANQVEIVSDGNGNVEWFLNGSSLGTSTGGPTGDSTANHTVIQFEAENGCDAASQEIIVGGVKLYVAQ